MKVDVLRYAVDLLRVIIMHSNDFAQSSSAFRARSGAKGGYLCTSSVGAIGDAARGPTHIA
jgi:hypothetical protein